MARPAMVHTAATRIRRPASELRLRVIAVLNLVRSLEAVSKAAYRLNQVRVELLAEASDEHFDRVRIAIEVLIIEMLHEFRTRNHAAAMMGEVGKQAIFERGELDRGWDVRLRQRSGPRHDELVGHGRTRVQNLRMGEEEVGGRLAA